MTQFSDEGYAVLPVPEETAEQLRAFVADDLITPFYAASASTACS